MDTILIIVHVVLAAALIGIVLVQRGQGATMGAAFGAGASGTVFGARGAGNFLTRTTGWLAVGFFGISLTLAVLAARNSVDAEQDLGVAAALVEQQEQSARSAEDGTESTTVTPEIPTESQGRTDDTSDTGVEAGELPTLPEAETDADESGDGGASGN